MIRLYVQGKYSHIKILSIYLLYIEVIYLWDILEYLETEVLFFIISGLVLLLSDIFISYKINKINFMDNENNEIYSLRNQF